MKELKAGFWPNKKVMIFQILKHKKHVNCFQYPSLSHQFHNKTVLDHNQASMLSHSSFSLNTHMFKTQIQMEIEEKCTLKRLKWVASWMDALNSTKVNQID